MHKNSFRTGTSLQEFLKVCEEPVKAEKDIFTDDWHTIHNMTLRNVSRARTLRVRMRTSSMMSQTHLSDQSLNLSLVAASLLWAFIFCMQIDMDETNIYSKNQQDWVNMHGFGRFLHYHGNPFRLFQNVIISRRYRSHPARTCAILFRSVEKPRRS